MKKLYLLAYWLLLINSAKAQLVEHYTFSNGTLVGVNNTNAGSQNLTALIDDPQGNTNEAIYLDGTDEYSLGSPAMSTGSGISLSFWFKPTQATTDNKVRVILRKRAACNGQNSMGAFVRNGQVVFEIRTPSGGSSIAVPYEVDEWQKVTFVADAQTTKLYAFKNGEFVSSKEYTSSHLPTSFPTTPIRLTGSPCIGVDGTLRYIGGLDELKFYNGILYEDEISAQYGSLTRSEFIESRMKVHYTLDSTLFNNRAFYTERNGNQAYYFTGENSLSYSRNGFSLNSGMSISFWIKPNQSVSGDAIILSQRSACTSVNMFQVVQQSATSSLIFQVLKQGLAVQTITLDYVPNVWQKCTFVVDRNTGELLAYRNGVEVNTKIVSSSLIPSSLATAPLRIADSPCTSVDGTPQFAGALDDIFVHEQVLSATEVLSTYTNGNDSQYNPVFSEMFDNVAIPSNQMTIVDRPLNNGTDKAVSLDGTVSYNLGSPQISTTSLSGYTFSFWLKPSSSSIGKGVIFSKRGGCSAADAFIFSYNPTNDEVTAEFRTLATGFGMQIPVVADEWQMVTVSVDLHMGVATSYVNGVEDDAKAIANIQFKTDYPQGNLQIANSPCVNVDGTRRVVGALDDLRIYGFPMNNSDVSEVYNSALITSIIEHDKGTKELFYPNPANDKIHTPTGTITIYDLTGHKVFQAYSSDTIDVSTLPLGMYIISNGSEHHSIVIE